MAISSENFPARNREHDDNKRILAYGTIFSEKQNLYICVQFITIRILLVHIFGSCCSSTINKDSTVSPHSYHLIYEPIQLPTMNPSHCSDGPISSVFIGNLLAMLTEERNIVYLKTWLLWNTEMMPVVSKWPYSLSTNMNLPIYQYVFFEATLRISIKWEWYSVLVNSPMLVVRNCKCIIS